jgi:DNA-directed RNA polymerase specialized sigma24 family protein
MGGHGEGAVPFGDIAFEELMTERFGGDVEAWNHAFSNILEAVMAAMRRRFGDPDLAEDVAQSALRTFIRRVRHDDKSTLKFEGPHELEGFLIVIAFRKAIRELRKDVRHRETLLRLARTGGGDSQSNDSGEREQLRTAIRAQFERMLEELKLSLKSIKGRKVSRDIIKNIYHNITIDDDAIARKASCSTRTVGRVRREIEQIWPRIVEEGQRAIRELEAELREPGS